MKNIKTFLSVDIDFWNILIYKENLLLSFLDKLQMFSKSNNIQISAVTNHQQMLDPVNKSGCNKLVNIDFHSDLADTSVDELNCGTWVSYVKWRDKGHYHWVRSNHAFCGDCNGSAPIFQDNNRKIRNSLKKTGWNNVTHEENKETDRYIDETIRQICICCSPAFSDKMLIKLFKKWVKDNQIPYKKGRNQEIHSRKISPK